MIQIGARNRGEVQLRAGCGLGGGRRSGHVGQVEPDVEADQREADRRAEDDPQQPFCISTHRFLSIAAETYRVGRQRQADDGDVILRSFTSHSRTDMFWQREEPSGSMCILVVEDERRIRAFLARAFEAEGFRVDVVEDGEQGLRLALTGSYKFVILDLLLPGLDGLAVLKELQDRKSTRLNSSHLG